MSSRRVDDQFSGVKLAPTLESQSFTSDGVFDSESDVFSLGFRLLTRVQACLYYTLALWYL